MSFTKIEQGKIYPDHKGTGRTIGKVTLSDTDKLPPSTCFDGDCMHILTCWNSNIYIKPTDKYGHFEVVETQGDELLTGVEYLLICPKY